MSKELSAFCCDTCHRAFAILKLASRCCVLNAFHTFNWFNVRHKTTEGRVRVVQCRWSPVCLAVYQVKQLSAHRNLVDRKVGFICSQNNICGNTVIATSILKSFQVRHVRGQFQVCHVRGQFQVCHLATHVHTSDMRLPAGPVVKGDMARRSNVHTAVTPLSPRR